MTDRMDAELRERVRERYALAARSSLERRERAQDGCCGAGGPGGTVSSCACSAGEDEGGRRSFPGAFAASLGCGNPTELAELRAGEDVLDLGSGGGLDVLLSARRVTPGGTAYGVDMTPEMLELAERHRTEAGVENARFLRGSIEAVPLPDASVDVVISNCVINLSTDKRAALAEAHRVLRPGGRLAIADIVMLREIPGVLRSVTGLWSACGAGALSEGEYLALLRQAGFAEARVRVIREHAREELTQTVEALDPADLPAGMDAPAVLSALEGAFASAFIRAGKPAG